MSGKILMLILDGIGDRPVKELDGKTPLGAANTPNLDQLASEGVNGIMDTISPGVRPGSDTGHLALLGYDPYEVYKGRGPFEAAGIGMELDSKDVAFRCNFATIKDGKIEDRRAGRIKEGTKELAKSINDIDLDVEFEFREAVEHRGVLVLKDKGLDGNVTDVDPHDTDVEVHEAKPIEDTKENRKTASILNEFTEKTIELLEDHPVNKQRVEEEKLPANVILARGGGKVPSLEDIKSKHGLESAAISGIPLVKGVCSMAGMKTLDVEGATGGMDTDIDAVVEASLDALESNDFVLVNIKGCDLSGHDGLPQEKIDFIEKMDAKFESLTSLDDTYLAVTGDHSTPVTVKDHSGDPLPLTIHGESVRSDSIEEYNERACSDGGLNRVRGDDLLNILKDLADITEKFGA